MPNRPGLLLLLLLLLLLALDSSLVHCVKAATAMLLLT
jgi:hypothetical protein